MAGRPMIVTVRSLSDGGSFDGSTEEKSAILTAALAGGAQFVDVEWDGPLRGWAIGAQASRIILSHHEAACESGTLTPLLSAMAGTHAARLKIVPRAATGSELRALYDLLLRAQTLKRDLCAFAAGARGSWTRVVALRWGSWGTYGAAAPGSETGDGQLTTEDLLSVYRVLAITDETRWHGVCGTPLAGSPSPAMHAAGYRSLGLDAVYLPVEASDIDEVSGLIAPDGLWPLSGFGVTIPLKEAVAGRCKGLDEFAQCGSVNTVVAEAGGWEGFNTDAPAALALIRKHIEPSGQRVAVVGAGGTARAIAAALNVAGAVVTLFSRSRARGEATAAAIGVGCSPLEALPKATWDILVQATPLGRSGEEILLRRHLGGSFVLDAAYGAEPTPLVRAARLRGLAVADGLDLMEEQGARQFERLNGCAAPRSDMAAALEPWRMGSGA